MFRVLFINGKKYIFNTETTEMYTSDLKRCEYCSSVKFWPALMEQIELGTIVPQYMCDYLFVNKRIYDCTVKRMTRKMCKPIIKNGVLFKHKRYVSRYTVINYVEASDGEEYDFSPELFK